MQLRAIVPFALVLTACGAEVPDEIPVVGTVSSPIDGGYLDEESTQSVGIVHLSPNAFGACSGTLISPNVVLTAQHCVAGSSDGGSVLCGSTAFSNPYPANEFYVTTRTSFTQDVNNYHLAREVHVPPGGTGFCGRDVALIILNDAVTADEAPYARPRVDIQLQPEEEYYAIGFGARGGSDGSPSGTRYRRDQLFTQCIGAGCGQGVGITETEWLGDTGICQGDSGGGSFDLQGRVHGVVSRGAQGCLFPIYGSVFGWADWIKEVTVYAAGIGGIEPPPWAEGQPTDEQYNYPVGAVCEDLGDCPSGACLNGYCTRACDGVALCPDGYQCREDGFCELFVEPEPEGPSADDTTTVVSGGCAIAALDPTKPTPWTRFPWALGLAFSALLVARRRRR